MNHNIHVVARAVIINNGHIALCHTLKLKNNFYFLPGGHVENGESASETVIRELREEGGHNFQVKRFLGCLEFCFTPNLESNVCHNHEYNLIFECASEMVTSSTQFHKLEKDIEIVWVPIEKLNSIDLKPLILKTLISKWVNQNLDTAFISAIN